MLTFTFTGAEGKMTGQEVLTSGMVGQKVKFVFSPQWAELSKTVVYTAGDCCVVHPGVGEEDVIPAQVLRRPLEKLTVGVYGISPDGQVVIPTVRAEGPRILPGVEPQGDPETAPELPAWGKILGMMGDLQNLRTPRQDNLVAAINSMAPLGEQVGNIFEGRYGVLFGDNMVRKDDTETNGFHQLLMRQLGLQTCPYAGTPGATFGETAAQIYAGTGQESVVLVLAGPGDLEKSVPLGSYSDQSDTTLCGSINRMCRALLEKYPRAIHTVITPPFQTRYFHSGGITVADVADALVHICGSYGIPVYDYFRFSGICPGNLNLLTNDNCHWNQWGQHMAARNIARFLTENFRYFWCDVIPEPFPVGIRATFLQGSAVIFDRDDLQRLRDYLVVEACMNDGTFEALKQYTLSGTLEPGVSTITAGWKEFTATFQVNVTSAGASES